MIPWLVFLGAGTNAAADGTTNDDPFAEIREEREARSADEEATPALAAEPVADDPGLGLELIGRLGASDRNAEPVLSGGLGLDLFRRVVTDSGTWGSFEAQVRLVWDKLQSPNFEVHNLFLEKRFLFGRLNLVLGHFQVPFNLEALPIDTHTTLIQLGNRRALGLKHDWGAGLRGQLAAIDYDLAYSLGSGMRFDLDTRGMATGRLGWTSAADTLGLGLSAIGGERQVATTLREAGEPVTGWRVGADLFYRILFMRLLAEASAGQDRGRRVLGLLVRLEGESYDDLWHAAMQYGVNESPAVHGPDPTHRVELEAALRLLLLSHGSFLRINVATHDQGGPWSLVGTAMLYLRFD